MKKNCPITFNHDSKIIFQSFGLSLEQVKKIKDKIIFSIYNNHLKAHNEFENVKDAPIELKTLTGDLETALNLFENNEDNNITTEQFFVSFIFSEFHDLVMQMISLHRKLNDKNLSESTKTIIKSSVKSSSDKLKEREPYSLTPLEVLHKFDIIEKSKYSYERFCLLAYNENTYVDDLLKNIIN